MRRQFMPASILAFCLALALGMTGCGGAPSARSRTGTGPTGTTDTTRAAPSKAQFITSADAVCQQFRTSLAQFRVQTHTLVTLGDTPKGYALAATLARRVQSLEQSELDRLNHLTLPAGDTSAVTAYLRQGAESVALIGQLAEAFVKRDKAAISSREQSGSRMSATARGLAQGYGFKVCGRGVAGNGLS